MEKRYNLVYETEGKRIEKKNESSLYIKQIHEKEEEEEER